MHIIRLVGTMSKGVHFVLHPLLALTADQIEAFTGGNEDYGNIIIINLDDHAANCKSVCQEMI